MFGIHQVFYALAGECKSEVACVHAHSLGQLRVLAAVQMGLLDPDFKTERCNAYDQTRNCTSGNCIYALNLFITFWGITLGKCVVGS